MTAPGIVGMVVGFLLLDEQDAHTLTALRVTPLSMRRYLAYRVTVPLLVATASTLAGYRLIGVTPLALGSLFAISVVGALSAPLLALVLATAAPNKVAGFAIVKVLNGLNLLPIAAFFLRTFSAWLASSRHAADACLLVSRRGEYFRLPLARRDQLRRCSCSGRIRIRPEAIAAV
jgi:fluoroquinolone transport system permease protein